MLQASLGTPITTKQLYLVPSTGATRLLAEEEICSVPTYVGTSKADGF
jgi:hypothetical protein